MSDIGIQNNEHVFHLGHFVLGILYSIVSRQIKVSEIVKLVVDLRVLKPTISIDVNRQQMVVGLWGKIGNSSATKLGKKRDRCSAPISSLLDKKHCEGTLVEILVAISISTKVFPIKVRGKVLILVACYLVYI